MSKVFEIWTSAAELARILGENPVTVRAWRRRKSIPADRDTDLVAAAQREGKCLTLLDLAEDRASRRTAIPERAAQ